MQITKPLFCYGGRHCRRWTCDLQTHGPWTLPPDLTESPHPSMDPKLEVEPTGAWHCTFDPPIAMLCKKILKCSFQCCLILHTGNRPHISTHIYWFTNSDYYTACVYRNTGRCVTGLCNILKTRITSVHNVTCSFPEGCGARCHYGLGQKAGSDIVVNLLV